MTYLDGKNALLWHSIMLGSVDTWIGIRIEFFMTWLVRLCRQFGGR